MDSHKSTLQYLDSTTIIHFFTKYCRFWDLKLTQSTPSSFPTTQGTVTGKVRFWMRENLVRPKHHKRNKTKFHTKREGLMLFEIILLSYKTYVFALIKYTAFITIFDFWSTSGNLWPFASVRFIVSGYVASKTYFSWSLNERSHIIFNNCIPPPPLTVRFITYLP